MKRLVPLPSFLIMTLLLLAGSKSFSYAHEGTFPIRVLCDDTSRTELTMDVCEDSFTFNGTTYHQSGIHKQTFKNAAGCDSNVYLTLNLKAEKPFIAVDVLTLSTTHSYKTYRWYKNDTAIAGATNPIHVLVPPLPAYYYVVVNEAFCPDTSEYYIIHEGDVNIQEQQAHSPIRIYPNPTSGQVHIAAAVPVKAQILSIQGKILRRLEDAKSFSLEDLPSGVYFIRILDGENRSLGVERLIKK